MIKYCPECGKKLEEDFKFCPECGNKTTGKFTFCPECGKKISLPQPKKAARYKRRKTRFSIPKILLKLSRKTALVAIIVICLVVVGASIVVFSPFVLNGSTSAGRIFTITVENTFNADAVCELKVGHLKHGGSHTVSSFNTISFQVYEDNLPYRSSEYSMTLYVTINDIVEEATADIVTDSAVFRISASDVQGEFKVNCTVYQ